eukprot:scaffold36972_cov27-Prasinocladus_malaysianus.AAC.3
MTYHCVYIVRAVGSPTFKVGFSARPFASKRLDQHFNSLGPCEFHTFPVANGRAVEMVMLAKLRISGALLRHTSGQYSEVAAVGDGLCNLLDSIKTAASYAITATDEPLSDMEVDNQVDETDLVRDPVLSALHAPTHESVARLVTEVHPSLSYRPRSRTWTMGGETIRCIRHLVCQWVRSGLVSQGAADDPEATRLIKLTGTSAFAKGVVEMLQSMVADPTPEQEDVVAVAHTDSEKSKRDDNVARAEDYFFPTYVRRGEADDFVSCVQFAEAASTAGVNLSKAILGRLVRKHFGIRSAPKKINGVSKAVFFGIAMV